MKLIVSLFLLCVYLTACGQKGPLYLPQDEKPKQAAVKSTPVPVAKVN